MNKNKYIWVLIFVAVLAISAVAIGRKINPRHSAQLLQPQERSVAEHVTYRMLFHHLHLLNQKADEAEREGAYASASAYRKALTDDAQLSKEQTQALVQIAGRCELAVLDIDRKAKVIIDARREHYQKTGVVLPPSEMLEALQAERHRTILYHRDELGRALGAQEWSRFQGFVQARVVPNITTTRSSP